MCRLGVTYDCRCRSSALCKVIEVQLDVVDIASTRDSMLGVCTNSARVWLAGLVCGVAAGVASTRGSMLGVCTNSVQV